MKNALAGLLIGLLLVIALLDSGPGINQYGPSPRNFMMEWHRGWPQCMICARGVTTGGRSRRSRNDNQGSRIAKNTGDGATINDWRGAK